jgi:hypothetical protein
MLSWQLNWQQPPLAGRSRSVILLGVIQFCVKTVIDPADIFTIMFLLATVACRVVAGKAGA